MSFWNFAFVHGGKEDVRDGNDRDPDNPHSKTESCDSDYDGEIML